MKTLLALVTSSTLVLIAGLPEGEHRWWLALLGCAAVWLLRLLADKEERGHHEAAAERASRRFADDRHGTPQGTLAAHPQDRDDLPSEWP